MTRAELIQQIKIKKSFLCVGLDTDITKIPEHLLAEEDPIYTFNKAIIDATSDLCVAYKPNIAFYESYGIKGWQSLQKTWEALPKDCLSIADAKRGDIGNTSKMYAQAFKDKGLAPENLSRTLEDSGTVTSVLIPGNTCGAYHSGVLGVDTLHYAGYAIFNWLSPFTTLLFAAFRIKIRQLATTETA